MVVAVVGVVVPDDQSGVSDGRCNMSCRSVLIMNNATLEWWDSGRRCLRARLLGGPTCQYRPDFVKLAEAYGAFGVRATRPDELSEVLFGGFVT